MVLIKKKLVWGNRINEIWNYDIVEPSSLFFSLYDLDILAQLNKEFRNAFSLIRQNDGIEILINANKNKLVS